jgi:hypothetical protein
MEAKYGSRGFDFAREDVVRQHEGWQRLWTISKDIRKNSKTKSMKEH